MVYIIDAWLEYFVLFGGAVCLLALSGSTEFRLKTGLNKFNGEKNEYKVS